MLALLVNTIGPDARIALIEEGKVLVERSIAADRSLSRRLPEEIDLLLEEAGLDKSDIKRVAVHQGPGHFGSLRTGIVIASSLAYALGVELAAVEGESWEENVEEAESVAAVEGVKARYENKNSKSQIPNSK